MPELSRRTLLVGATTLVTIPAGRASAEAAKTAKAASAPPGISTRTPGSVDAPREVTSGRLGPLLVSITLGAGVDAVGMRLVIQNTGEADETVTVTVTDHQTNASRRRTLIVPAWRTRSRRLYGELNRRFTVQLCLADNTCLLLGPIGPQLLAAAEARRPRGLSVPPPGAG